MRRIKAKDIETVNIMWHIHTRLSFDDFFCKTQRKEFPNVCMYVCWWKMIRKRAKSLGHTSHKLMIKDFFNFILIWMNVLFWFLEAKIFIEFAGKVCKLKFFRCPCKNENAQKWKLLWKKIIIPAISSPIFTNNI